MAITKQKKITIGRSDYIDLPDLGLTDVTAKVDTGAQTSSIHAAKIKLVKEEDKQYLTFYIPQSKIYGIGKKKLKVADFTMKEIKSSTGHIESRFVIRTRILLFNKLYETEFSLADRSTMKFPILLGRRLLSKRFIVDVAYKDLSYQQKINS